MKKFIPLAALLALLLIVGCSTQIYLNKEELSEISANKEFTFMAQRATPTGADVINVMNSLPYRGGAQILDLSYGYSIVLKASGLSVALPYFGRVYTPSYDQSKAGYNFTSKKFTVAESLTKKGERAFSILPEDVPGVQKITIVVYKNGGAYATIDSNDRQPIFYDGYIMKNPAK